MGDFFIEDNSLSIFKGKAGITDFIEWHMRAAEVTMIFPGLVPDETVHKDNNRPLFCTRGDLTFDITISLYLIFLFSFL